MATYTTNLDLKKPAQSDKIRIADINNNMDTIDGVVGDVGERSIAAQIGDVEGALAIVSTGNVHGAITSGQYVYIKNHDTLDDGLYVATTNISANGTLSSSNVTADSAGGGLNALNGKLNGDTSWTTLNSTYPTYYRKVAGIVTVVLRCTGGATPPSGESLGTLPNGYRPYMQIVSITQNARGSFMVDQDGKVTIDALTGQTLNSYVGCVVSYPV